MIKLIVFLFLFCPVLCFAQKEELKQWCRTMDQDFNSLKNMHIQYVMTIVGRADNPGKESLTFDLYKAGNQSKVVMGNAQDLLQDGMLTVVANHIDKNLTVSKGNKEPIGQASLFGILSSLVDSAAIVKKKNDATYSTYFLYYPKDYMYSLLRFSFHTSTRQLVALYAEFNPVYREPYYSMEINYKKWDYKWKPETGFPHVEQYVIKKGERYQPQAAWKNYAFHQAERGRL